ncbi:hypothetical protein PG985_016370 [Apiospora marii]|uniref:uncharacterized protein n=1 Tax=Apiospora marii TaxID=335849 RepID=UPI003130458A
MQAGHHGRDEEAVLTPMASLLIHMFSMITSRVPVPVFWLLALTIPPASRHHLASNHRLQPSPPTIALTPIRRRAHVASPKPLPMSPNTTNNHGPGPQNTVTGSGEQNNNDRNGWQFNHSTIYGCRTSFRTEKRVRMALSTCLLALGYFLWRCRASYIANSTACLRSLAFREIDARRHDIAPAYRDTCDWLFDTTEFRDWRDPASLPTHNGVLWIKGKPGAGKSTLMKHAYLRYQKEFFRDHLIVAFFFNARGETLEKTPLGMLRSIVYQLLQDDDGLYERFVPSFRAKQRTSRERDWQWRPSELQGFIRSVVQQPRSQPLLLLVDALDECDESEVRDVVEFLESLSVDASRDSGPLQICLSSRHYPSIRMKRALELTVEESLDHQNDIAKYIGEKLQVREAEIETEIKRRAEGVFLWVVIVVSLLNRAYDEGRVEAMRKTLEGVPSRLEEIFDTILGKDVVDMGETVRMLQWVLLSQRLLKPLELFAAAVTVGMTRPAIDVIQRRITTSSRGLIEVRKGMAESVQFIHLSVNDFLFRQKRLQALDPTLGPEPLTASHGRLWARCWSSIQHVATVSMDTQHIKSLTSEDPFLGYAASHILNHAERALSQDVMAGENKEPEDRESSPYSSDISPATGIQQWLRELDGWFQRWKQFVIATDSNEFKLEKGVDVGLVYTLASNGLPNLLGAIAERCNVNTQGGKYGNALQAASVRGSQEVVRLLLEKGADVHAQGGKYGNALQAASLRGSQEVVRLLLEKGADQAVLPIA